MVDGTGMCGGCRVTIGGETRYACVDGPEFDGHEVDFKGLSDRLQTYRIFETGAMEKRESCKIGGRVEPAAAGAPSTGSEPAR